MKNLSAILLLSVTALSAFAAEPKCSATFTTDVVNSLDPDKAKEAEALVMMDMIKVEGSSAPSIVDVETCKKLFSQKVAPESCKTTLQSAVDTAVAVQGRKLCVKSSTASGGGDVLVRGDFVEKAMVAEVIVKGGELGLASATLSDELCKYYGSFDLIEFKKLKGDYATMLTKSDVVLGGLAEAVKDCHPEVVVDEGLDPSKGFALIRGFKDGKEIITFMTEVNKDQKLVAKIPSGLKATAAQVDSWIADINAIDGHGKLLKVQGAGGPEVLLKDPTAPARGLASVENVNIVSGVLTAVSEGSTANIANAVQIQTGLESMKFNDASKLNPKVLEILGLCNRVEELSKVGDYISSEDPADPYPTGMVMMEIGNYHLIPQYRNFVAQLSQSKNFNVLFNLYSKGIVTRNQVSNWEKGGFLLCYKALPDSVAQQFGASELLKDLIADLKLSNSALALSVMGASGVVGFDYSNYVEKVDYNTQTITAADVGTTSTSSISTTSLAK